MNNVNPSLRAKDGKQDLLDSLLRALDTIIFLEIALLYCCDNLTFLLALRSICQVLYVQARPPPLTGTTQLTPTVSANLICLVTHLLHARPEASRATRGYLHGGLIVEFVGEHGPISQWRLLYYDVLVLGLQLLMLAVGHKRQELTESKEEDPKPAQDLDAEEAGVRRSQEDLQQTVSGENEDSIEMQNLLPGNEEHQVPRDSSPYDMDNLLVTLNLKQSLGSLFRRSTTASPGSNASPERLERVRLLLGRIAADRAASTG